MKVQIGRRIWSYCLEVIIESVWESSRKENFCETNQRIVGSVCLRETEENWLRRLRKDDHRAGEPASSSFRKLG